jgi:hypothetical protein
MKSLLYGDVSEKTMMVMLDSFSVGTLTFVRAIETFIESVFTTVPKRFVVVDRFFTFGEDS